MKYFDYNFSIIEYLNRLIYYLYIIVANSNHIIYIFVLSLILIAMQILIGTIIREYCDNNKITVKKLAALVGVTPDALYKMIRSNQISINLLQRISAALNFNFFSYYGATTESESNKQELEALRSAFASQKQEMDQMKIRMQLLEQENTYLKQINRLLEGKSITN